MNKKEKYYHYVVGNLIENSLLEIGYDDNRFISFFELLGDNPESIEEMGDRLYIHQMRYLKERYGLIDGEVVPIWDMYVAELYRKFDNDDIPKWGE